MTQLAIWFTLLIIIALLIIALPILRKQKEPNPLVQKSLYASLFLAPVIALGGYFYLGTPQFAEMQTNPEPPKVVSLADELHEKLKKNPDDLKGWLLLGRSYMIEERTDLAIMAFEKALSLKANNLDAMLPLADALAVKANGQLQGRPFELLEKSYQISPNNKMVLWLLGMAHKQMNQPQQAQKLWLTLYNQLSQEDADRPIIARLLKSVGYGGAVEVVQAPEPTWEKVEVETPMEAALGEPSNQVTIKIDNLAQIKQKYTNSTAFIYAKAQQGMPMPILALKLPVSQLQETMRLSDKDLIMPNRQLTAETRFIVGMRISQSGAVNENSSAIKQEVEIGHGEIVVLNFND